MITLAEWDWRRGATGLLVAVAATVALTLGLSPVQGHLGLLNVGLAFLLLTLLISARWGRFVGIVTAVSTNLALNFFFVEPHSRFAIDTWPGVLSLFVFLGVSVVGGTLLASARVAAGTAERRREETEVLLGLSRTLNAETDPRAALASMCREVVRAFDAPGASVLSPRGGAWEVLAAAGWIDSGRLPEREERVLAQRALETRQPVFVGDAGLRPGRAPRIPAQALAAPPRSMAFVPLRVGDRVFGVLRLDGRIAWRGSSSDAARLLEPFVTEAALAVERLELAQAAAHADALRQADELKTALMTSVSHDLKTPLAGIKTAVTSLLDTSVSWSPEDRREFLEAIESQSDRLDRVISDILNLTRIEQGAVAPLMAVVGARELLEEARERTEPLTRDREVTIDAEPSLEVRVDESLIVQALVNLIENAARYSRPAGRIALSASSTRDTVELAVADEGPGIPARELPLIFERFYRGSGRAGGEGSGLGLAVVRGFARLCRGEAFAESSAAGSRFVIRLPAVEAARS